MKPNGWPGWMKAEAVKTALRNATAQLASVTDTPRLDAELLLAHALGLDRDRLILDPPEAVPTSFEALVQRRLLHEPLAYITGMRDFWTISLEVTPDTLIPRPDSETLIEAALAHSAARAPARILDLGTGPGTLLLAALSEFPDASGLGVDRSSAALAVAARNAERLGLAARAAFQQGDWGAGLEERFNLILCNPPYVEEGSDLSPEVMNEPHAALFAGVDGLDDYRHLAPQLPALLAKGGCACIEIGYRQASAVTALLEAQGFAVALRQDLGGRDRCLIATLE